MANDGLNTLGGRRRGSRIRSRIGHIRRCALPSGTLGLQFPIFTALGVDLEGVHAGTINIELDDGPVDAGRPPITS